MVIREARSITLCRHVIYRGASCSTAGARGCDVHNVSRSYLQVQAAVHMCVSHCSFFPHNASHGAEPTQHEDNTGTARWKHLIASPVAARYDTTRQRATRPKHNFVRRMKRRKHSRRFISKQRRMDGPGPHLYATLGD